MTKSSKIFMIVVFIIIALLSGFFSLMIVGLGVSGSGCGGECLENSDTAKYVSCIFWALAITGCMLPVKSAVAKDDDSRN
ncbi:putative membrane protein [Enterobacteriaceae bacterium ATCC 29904]|nr:putative membrane protein [Enterobacteriaceae bacterium ATCC 29904]